eukprot:TRINITY_DN3999_c0_g1_i1.p1 TRINITY_DN3999_c0_g1~~TRINITY_DN3999_c0_g1_i1.p1  ORF type:complete len:424 (+),score=70.55 TRINITY_DN3999_c0_g1_i1:641-1912(+)
MHSSSASGPSLYGSIPTTSTARLPSQNGIRTHSARFSRASSISRVLNAAAMMCAIGASLFVISSLCLSCHLFALKHRLSKLTSSHSTSRVPPYSRIPLEYAERAQSRAHGAFAPRRQSVYASHAFNRHPAASNAYHASARASSEQASVTIERVATRDCTGSANLGCSATIVLTEQPSMITVQAGYVIQGFNGDAGTAVNPFSRKRISAITREETLHLAEVLLTRIGDDLSALNCTVTPMMIAVAVFQSAASAAQCVNTNHELCNTLFTIEQCFAPGAAPQQSCQAAFERCAFTFAGERGLAAFRIGGTADVSFTPRIVAKDDDVQLGVLHSNHQVAQFIEHDGVFAITNFGSQRFAPTQFQPYALWPANGSGIGHQTFHGDQLQLASGRCVRIFFSEIQLLEPPSYLRHVAQSENKCVVFRTL